MNLLGNSEQNYRPAGYFLTYILKLFSDCVYVCVCLCMCPCTLTLHHIRLFATPWTVVLQAPLSYPGKNTEVGGHFLLQGIFPTQGSSPGVLHLLHWQEDSSPLNHLGSPFQTIKITRSRNK